MEVMMKSLKNVYDLKTLLNYCADNLDWAIDCEYFDDIDELTYDFDASDLDLKDEAFARIRSLKQLRRLSDNQPWGIFAIDFESKHIDISAIRKILNRLAQRSSVAEYKTWDCDRLLFLCFWGEIAYRTIGFVAFEKNTDKTLPIIKSLYCTPKIEDRFHLENFECQVGNLKWPSSISDPKDWVTQWSNAFHTRRNQTIHDTRTLTEQLAKIALNISNNMTGSFSVEEDDGTVHLLYKRFNKALSISLSTKEFIDMYAQTIVYGLFSARCMRPDISPFTVDAAVECIPATNPLLRELLSECLAQNKHYKFDELEVMELVEFLDVIDIHHILDNFNRQTGRGKEDPVIYFYEGFLNIYEKEQKKRRGVYYTPTPAVNFMVHAVSYILHEKFDCKDGFSNNQVSVLDPAAGTGTFLRKIIYECLDEHLKGNQRQSWSEYVCQSLLPRIYGFEFMMAPYAVAHMKLAMTLKETGYDFASSQRLQVYLANSLEDSTEVSGTQIEDPLEIETNYAARARHSKINVIIGNPPYRTDSINKSDWIMSLMEDYKKEPDTCERLQERNPKVVNDDYVKFIRLAQELVQDRDQAVIAFIHPHSYMDNLTFRGMRWHLLSNFDEIYIIDFHGNVMSRESSNINGRDENVFDIQQGVCVSFFIKKEKSSKALAKVYYSEVYGSRTHKYEYLECTSFSEVKWKEVIPYAPNFFFKPKDFSNATAYKAGISLSELFPVSIGGIKTHNDSELVSNNAFDTDLDQLYDYRPFDLKHINYDRTKVERPRYEVMKHFVGHKNIGLVINRQVVTDNWSHVQIVEHMIDNRLHYSRKGIPVVCPLYLYDNVGNKTANINTELVSKFEVATEMHFSGIEKETSDSFTVLDLVDYCYGVLFSTAYRQTYKDLLSIDFPRVPLPKCKNMFVELINKGTLLRNLHTMKRSVNNALNISFSGNGNNEIFSPTYASGVLHINKTQKFENIREDLWDFCFGGYHGLQKWFKDRNHQTLSVEDIDHIISVFNIFDQTQLIMTEIDDVFLKCNIELSSN